MKYEEFRMEMIDRIRDYLPAEYRCRQVTTRYVEKVNCRMEALQILPNQKEAFSQALYFEEYYNRHQKGYTVEEVLKQAAEDFLDATDCFSDYAGRTDIFESEDKIIFTLINTEKNRHMLKGVPHREIMDLSVIYRLAVEMTDSVISSAMITFSMAEHMGLTEEELYRIAADNTPKKMPLRVLEMGNELYMIGNERNLMGAAAMLYDGVLRGISEKTGTDLFIMPSSIHEVLAVPAYLYRQEDLRRIVHTVNRNVVEKCDFLSDRVYFYSRGSKMPVSTEVERAN